MADPTPDPKPTEHWIEIGAGRNVRMLDRLKAGSGPQGPLVHEYSTDGEAWFTSTILAYRDGKAKDVLIYHGDAVDQGGVEAWLLGMVGMLKKLTPGTFLKVHCVGDMLLVTQETEVLEPIRMSEIRDLDLDLKAEEPK